jgi:hypothetical protein
MQTAEAFEKERLEVDAVLASGIFNRAPNLALLMKYVCEKYFDGSAGEIKEYNIAVDALGRRPDFDQKRDSIVRVEAHRLRKRLKEYYEGQGSLHELQIEIPSGQYTPKFIRVSPSEPAPGAQPEAAPPPQAPGSRPILAGLPVEEAIAAIGQQSAGHPRETAIIPVVREPVPLGAPLVGGLARSARATNWLNWLVVPGIAVLLAGAAFFALGRSHSGRISSAASVFPAVLPGDEVRILCGVESGSYTDSFERNWQSDRYFTGGFPAQSPSNQVIWGTRDQQIYRNRREGSFRYDIPLKPGVYELRLYFAETLFGENNAAGGGETTRLFQVRLNGKPVESLFDVIADAGSPSTADIKVFKDVSPAADGKVHLEFLPDTKSPFLNAIAIQPGIAGKIRPYRIAARDHGLTDAQGVNWDPDHYARGGQLIARLNSNVQNADPELFRSERFGNISYTLPVAQPGKYTVNLYFAENWFGEGNPGGGGVGNRTFDILVNGAQVKKNFDILKESGSINRAAIVTQRGVEPNHQGKIVISLVPVENYAAINALEVIDESK